MAFFLNHPSAASAATVGDPAHPETLWSAVLAAYASGQRQVAITPGTYLIPHTHGPASLTLQNVKDFEIDADRVELVIQDVGKEALGLYGCENVIIRGATLHFPAPQTSQAKIIAIGKDATGSYYDVQIEPGYRTDADFKIGDVFDAQTHLWKPGGPDFGAKSIVPLSQPGSERIYWGSNAGQPTATFHPEIGDYVTSRGPGGIMIHLSGCTHCAIEDTHIYWGGIFGFLDADSGVGNRYIGDTISYGPAPPGATMPPLISQSADGLHCAGDVVGPDIENCAFEGTPDDGIAIHGADEWVAHADGPVLTVGSRAPQTQFSVGSPIRIQNDQTGFIADAKVTAVEPATYDKTQTSHAPRFNIVALHYFQVTIDQTLPIPDDSLASNPDRCGAGYKIIDCKILNNRARGFLLKADNGLVSGNTIDGSTLAGIVVTPETAWTEAGYSHHVVITGNTVERTGRGGGRPATAQAAAITIGGMGSIGNEDIQIVGNTIRDVDTTNLIVRWTDGAVIKDNMFINSHQETNPVPNIGQATGIDPDAVIWLGDCRNVTLSSNLIEHSGSFTDSPLVVAPTAQNVTGATGGVTTH